MTQEIFERLNKRRKVKNNVSACKKLDREIRSACLGEKSLCSTTNARKWKQNPQLKHIKIKKATRNYRTCSWINCIEAEEGTIIMETEKIVERWRECIYKLFEEERLPEYLIAKIERENLPILKEKSPQAINSMPNVKQHV